MHKGTTAKNAILEAGAVPALVALLNHYNDPTRRNAANVLRWVAKEHSPGQEAIARAGGIQALVSVLPDTDEALVGNAVAALKWLVHDHRANKKIVARLAKDPAVKKRLIAHDIPFKTSFFW